MPDVKKYLNRDGLEDYNSLLPHSAGEMQAYVNTWLTAHPEATTTVQDGSVTAQKLAAKSVTRGKLADDVTNLLAGMMLTGETQGELITVNDAWGIEPITLSIEGKSTQTEIPTPENPIPIVSLEALAINVHASADGTTDYGNWPAYVPLGQYSLRSLPIGTKDTLEITYLRPSTRNGWAVYARELVQAIGHVVLNGTETWAKSSGTSYRMYTTRNDMVRATNYSQRILCTSLQAYPRYDNIGFGTTGISAWSGSSDYPGKNWFYVSINNITTATAIRQWFADNPAEVLYELITPIITQLDPVELPILPAPTCTLWSDPTTGLKMSYMRNSNIVISDIEQAIADL